MSLSTLEPVRRKSTVHRWVQRGFLVWAVVSTTYLANSFRTRGVDPASLTSSSAVSVVEHRETLEFLPTSSEAKPGLIFLCGSGVSAHAYAPLLRPIAEAGFPVFVVKLPYRFAPFERHKQGAIDRARAVRVAHPEIPRWVVSALVLAA